LNGVSVTKAEESYRYDYWFTPEGIYRVPIISYGTALAPFIIAYLLVGLFGQLIPTTLAALWLGLFILAFAAAYFGLVMMATRKRKKICPSPSKEFFEAQKTRKISWEEIKSVSITRKRNVAVSVGIHRYRSNVKPADYDLLKGMLSSEIGARLQIREGTFR
jgi:hypothetical protein